jgi:hypothetical protein
MPGAFKPIDSLYTTQYINLIQHPSKEELTLDVGECSIALSPPDPDGELLFGPPVEEECSSRFGKGSMCVAITTSVPVTVNQVGNHVSVSDDRKGQKLSPHAVLSGASTCNMAFHWTGDVVVNVKVATDNTLKTQIYGHKGRLPSLRVNSPSATAIVLIDLHNFTIDELFVSAAVGYIQGTNLRAPSATFQVGSGFVEVSTMENTHNTVTMFNNDFCLAAGNAIAQPHKRNASESGEALDILCRRTGPQLDGCSGGGIEGSTGVEMAVKMYHTGANENPAFDSGDKSMLIKNGFQFWKFITMDAAVSTSLYRCAHRDDCDDSANFAKQSSFDKIDLLGTI